MNDRTLSKEDYEEPRCPLCMPTEVVSIPCGRVIEKLDEYLGRNDYASAQRHLKYWLDEAEAGLDRRGALTVINEQIGLYRKTDKPDEGLCAIEKALALVEELKMGDSVTAATTFVNAATAYKAFGDAEKALPLYERAREIYEDSLDGNDSRLGGLYNNMALTLTALEKYDDALALYEKAIEIMSNNDNGEAEEAITYCNLADLAAARYGEAEGEKMIYAYLDKAYELLDTKTLPRNGYYAFVCEKCAPTFGYYGYFLAEQKLTEQAREIYERS